MPIGEHLLRLVEQIELVASSTSDLLLAFRVNLTTEAMEGEWRDVRTDMDHYGEQAEKAALQRAEMPLKKGIVGCRASNSVLVRWIPSGEHGQLGFVRSVQPDVPDSHRSRWEARIGGLLVVVISCYVENLCGIPRIKYSGSQQLAKDVG